MYLYSSTEIVVNIIKILILQKFEVFFGFVHLFAV